MTESFEHEHFLQTMLFSIPSIIPLIGSNRLPSGLGVDSTSLVVNSTSLVVNSSSLVENLTSLVGNSSAGTRPSFFALHHQFLYLALFFFLLALIGEVTAEKVAHFAVFGLFAGDKLLWKLFASILR